MILEKKYHENGNLKSFEKSILTISVENGDSEVRKSEKDFYSYNEQGLKTSHIKFEGDEQNWVKNKVDFEYYENAQLLSEIHFDWDKDLNDWKVWLKRVFEYDEKGQEISETSWYWNFESKTFERKRKHCFEYNEAGLKTVQIQYKPNLEQNEWIESKKESYEYNEKGSKILENKYTWNELTKEWDNSDKKYYDYNENGLLVSILRFLWDTEKSDWRNFSKNIHNYNENGMLISYKSFKWGEINGKTDWQPISQEQIEYDEKHRKKIWITEVPTHRKKLIIEYLDDKYAKITTYYWDYKNEQWFENHSFVIDEIEYIDSLEDLRYNLIFENAEILWTLENK